MKRCAYCGKRMGNRDQICFSCRCRATQSTAFQQRGTRDQGPALIDSRRKRRSRIWFIPVAILALALIAAAAFFGWPFISRLFVNERGFGPLEVDMSRLLEGYAEEVTFTVPAGRNARVELVGPGESVAAVMHDDGEAGDRASGDGVYSCRLAITPGGLDTMAYYARTDRAQTAPWEISVFTEAEMSENLERAERMCRQLGITESFFFRSGDHEADTELLKKTYLEVMSCFELWTNEGILKDYEVTGTTVAADLGLCGFSYTFDPLGMFAGTSSGELEATTYTANGETGTPRKILTVQPFRHNAFEEDEEMRVSHASEFAANILANADIGYGYAKKAENTEVK